MSGIAALIVAAGRGERAGSGVPKQYRLLAGLPVWRHSAQTLCSCRAITNVMVAISPEHEGLFEDTRSDLDILPPVFGGATRQASVRAGLEALRAHTPDMVLIHDAARPLVSPALVDRVISELQRGTDAAIPLLPVPDTLRLRDANGEWTTVPREGIFRAQTPQGFAFSKILQAHRDFAQMPVTDDMALAELAGLKTASVLGDEMNLKLTEPADFVLAERMLGGLVETRVGFGFDAHRFANGNHVWLCGVKIPHDSGLEGHSDADAGLHALTDAILGAISAGDIGEHFPASDPRWRGASSHVFLEHAAALVGVLGGSVMQCDVTVIAERPKIAPYRAAMRGRIAEILKIDISRVNVKGTTTEGMGFTGRGEGLAAQALASVAMPRR